MKKNIAIIALSLCIVIVLNMFFNEKGTRNEFEDKMNEWKSIAKSEQEIPNINERGINFVKALNKGKHKDYLTGQALNDYTFALESKFEFEEDEEHTDHSLQELNILLSNTQLDKKKVATSKIIYQVHYTSIFDNPNIGVLDQRILTFVMTIEWDKQKVNRYKIVLLNDTMGIELPSQLEGSIENE